MYKKNDITEGKLTLKKETLHNLLNVTILSEIKGGKMPPTTGSGDCLKSRDRVSCVPVRNN